MLKLQLSKGSIIEIDSSEASKGTVLRCKREPALARMLSDLLDVNTLPASLDAELHIASKIMDCYKGAQVIETSREHYTSRKPKQ